MLPLFTKALFGRVHFWLLSSSGPRSPSQLFVRDFPPQSHISTEDRCLLCLIKALPPGVIPQFELEERPVKGENVLDQSSEGPILYTLIEISPKKRQSQAACLTPSTPSSTQACTHLRQLHSMCLSSLLPSLFFINLFLPGSHCR